MKTLRLLTAVLTLTAVLLTATPDAEAKKKVVDIYDLSLDDNLELPETTSDKQAANVQDYQYKTAVELKKKNYDVETMRNNEVIIVTLPASVLFDANDTVLTAVGANQLRPLLAYLDNPGFYKMLLVMHSDNTGSDVYTLNLTRQRVNAVFDWIDDHASVDFVVPYALGDTDPITDNNSLDSRKRNRRLEIYLVPEEGMLNQAKKGKPNIKQKQ